MRHSNGERRITLQDIAKRTGYSLTAVSRALRNMSDIGAEATAQIKQAAQEMGYVANQTAVALRYGRTNIITVILVNLTNPFFSIMANLIQIAAQEMGYSLVIVCSRDDPALERQLVEQAIARRSDGVLLFPTRQSGPAIELLQGARIPFVLLSSVLPPYQTDSVVIDDEQGAYLAAMHLIESGHRKLAFLSSSDAAPSYSPRKNGFLRACDQAGIALCDRRIHTIPYLHISTAQQNPQQNELLDLLLQLRSEGFNGLFVFCDVEAWRVMGALQQTDTLRPEDFSIVSFDNIDGALVSPIPLCSVDCNLGLIAQQSMELLRSRIQGDARPPQTIVCPVSIVCRNSCHRR